MPYTLYDFLEVNGRNSIKAWTEGLQKRDRARLNQKLDMLEQHGAGLPPGLLSNTGAPHIKKLRITGRKVPTLRPMLCQGPINNNEEFTLLQGAVEQDRELVPADALKRAKENRKAVVNNPSRRCLHDRVA